MNKYDAYDLAMKVINRMNMNFNNPILPTGIGKQLLIADYEYLCKQLEPIVEAYGILKGEMIRKSKRIENEKDNVQR